MPVQWVHLGAGRTLVASSRGAWFQADQPGAMSFSGPMPDALGATPATVRNLLDGAIAAAERSVPRVSAPTMTELRWAWHLVGQWHCAHHSFALLPALIDRFEAAGRDDLVRFAAEKLDDERGHDAFPLADLAALGFDGEALVAHVAPEPAVALSLAFARACAQGDCPVAFFGYVYALERRVLRLTPAWFAALDAVLPPGVEAASGLRAHACELDIAHVDDAVAVIAALPARDRTAIALACHRTTELCCSPHPEQFPSERELAERLGSFRRVALTSDTGTTSQGAQR